MSEYVLVAGAWRGGWIWKRVSDLLAAKGHRVLTPTLTGRADRSHLNGTLIACRYRLSPWRSARWRRRRPGVLSARCAHGPLRPRLGQT
jgi:hypothetical protein